VKVRRTTASELDLEGYEDHIETIFKTVPPVEKLSSGFGYLGVLLRDPKEDRLQCHICGKWCKSLGKHSQMLHGISATEYRYKFHIPNKFPLVSVGISKSFSERSRRPEFIANLKKHNGSAVKRSVAARGQFKKSKRLWFRNNRGFENMYGLCPQQIDRRYLIASDLAGRQATHTDLEKYDPALRAAIIRRFGNLNAYRKAKGLTLVAWRPKIGRDEILSAILKVAEEKRRIPLSSDFNKKGAPVSIPVIYREFGSWSRALRSAGFKDLASYGN
jgi:hypothetical protein